MLVLGYVSVGVLLIEGVGVCAFSGASVCIGKTKRVYILMLEQR